VIYRCIVDTKVNSVDGGQSCHSLATKPCKVLFINDLHLVPETTTWG